MGRAGWDHSQETGFPGSLLGLGKGWLPSEASTSVLFLSPFTKWPFLRGLGFVERTTHQAEACCRQRDSKRSQEGRVEGASGGWSVMELSGHSGEPRVTPAGH